MRDAGASQQLRRFFSSAAVKKSRRAASSDRGRGPRKVRETSNGATSQATNNIADKHKNSSCAFHKKIRL